MTVYYMVRLFRCLPVTAIKHSLLNFFFGIILLILLPACNGKDQQESFVIGFSQCVESDAWRKTMLEEMKRELSFHPGVEFIYKEADGNSDTQITQVKELLDQRVD